MATPKKVNIKNIKKNKKQKIELKKKEQSTKKIEMEHTFQTDEGEKTKLNSLASEQKKSFLEDTPLEAGDIDPETFLLKYGQEKKEKLLRA